MSSEPRMRGTRFRRPTSRKHSREKSEEPQTPVSYQEVVPVDPSQVSSRILNALEHLGTQRFGLPPFSEHYERWIKDVEAVLADFETELPNTADQPYRLTVQTVLSSLRESLHKQTETEKDSSREASMLLQQLNTCEVELSNLEHEYGTQTYNARKRNERALGKLSDAIDELGRRRLRLLQKQSSILQRILHRPEAKLEENTAALQSKRNEFDKKGAMLQQELNELRSNFEAKRKSLKEQEEMLKTELTGLKRNTSNDAVDVRNAACQQLRLAVVEALDRSTKTQLAQSTENTQ